MSLLHELTTLAEHHPRRAGLRNELVTGYLPLAKRLARRFTNRGEPLDDLQQVALLGLINAIDRFDPERGTSFLSFAIPTIQGELRRHFRDRGWAMRVPRRSKDLHQTVSAAVAELSQQLHRAPRPSEIADRTDLSIDDVIEGLEAAQAYRCDSLDQALADDDPGGQTIGDSLGAPDPDLELVEDCQVLRRLLGELPERERAILMLRFYGNMTQTQIAQRIGLSQMHISRLLAQTLSHLRGQLQSG